MKDKYIRDVNNPGAVLNTDNKGLKAYKLRKKNNRQVSDLQMKVDQIDDLRQQVSEIKDMLNKIVEKIA